MVKCVMYSSTNVHNDPERLVKDPAPGASTAQCSVTVTTTRYKKLLQIQKSSKSSFIFTFSEANRFRLRTASLYEGLKSEMMGHLETAVFCFFLRSNQSCFEYSDLTVLLWFEPIIDRSLLFGVQIYC